MYKLQFVHDNNLQVVVVFLTIAMIRYDKSTK